VHFPDETTDGRPVLTGSKQLRAATPRPEFWRRAVANPRATSCNSVASTSASPRDRPSPPTNTSGNRCTAALTRSRGLLTDQPVTPAHRSEDTHPHHWLAHGGPEEHTELLASGLKVRLRDRTACPALGIGAGCGSPSELL
jgi:hypothetical protein